MNSRRDFGIARDQGWYRIPYSRAPSRVGADYLAFYQTKAFGQERWAIHYYARVRRFRIVCRVDLLPEEPDHPRADELYYKVEIGPLQRLPHSIPSHRLRRITFIPTTLGRLLRAAEINDLWRAGPTEERLWQAFKDTGISAERKYPLREEEEAYHIDFAIFCEEGKIAVLLEGQTEVDNVCIVREHPALQDYDLAASGWRIVRFSCADLVESLPRCLDAIRAAIGRYGGISRRAQG